MTKPITQADHYLPFLKLYPENDGKSLAWGSTEAQFARFDIIKRIMEDHNNANAYCNYDVLDVGCGFADFSTKMNDGCYHGIDVLQEMIHIATTERPLTTSEVEVADIINYNPQRNFDYVVASGPFNLNQGDTNKQNDDYLFTRLKRMWDLSRKGIVFNLLSQNSKQKLSGLCYRSAMHVYHYLSMTMSNKILVDHSYMDNDFTIGVFR